MALGRIFGGTGFGQTKLNLVCANWFWETILVREARLSAIVCTILSDSLYASRIQL